MKAQKYYFRHRDSEICYTMDYHIEQAKDEGLNEIEVYRAVPQNATGVIWCKHERYCGEKGMCGKVCRFYKPRNGKSGICKHQGRLYVPAEKVTIPVR